MAITLDSMTSIAILSQGTSASASTSANQTTGAFALASQRISQKLNSTDVQLSAFGQISSGFASVQSASKGLTNPAKNATPADIVSAVQNFANAYNTATQAVSTATNGTGNGNGVLAKNFHAQFAGNDLKSVLTSGTNTTDFSKIGVTVNKNGTLSVNTQTLQAAIQANPTAVTNTLANIGQQAGQVSTKELANTGNVGGAVNTLSATAKTLQTQSAAQQKLASDSQLAIQQQAATIGNTASSIASYMQIFSL